MNKRGQIYILVALIMSVIIFGMVTVSNRVVQESLESSFETLSKNYAVEGAKLINSLIGTGDIVTGFKDFTVLFTSYSKTQNPRFELIYALDYNSTFYVGNYLKSRMFVCVDKDCTCTPEFCLPPLEGCYSLVPASISFDGLAYDPVIYSSIMSGNCEFNVSYGPGKAIENIDTAYIIINDITYPFSITKGRPEVVAVSWETKAQQRKVFAEGTIIPQETGNPAMTLSKYCHNTCDPSYCSEAPGCFARCGFMITEDECSANSGVEGDCVWIEGESRCGAKTG